MAPLSACLAQPVQPISSLAIHAVHRLRTDHPAPPNNPCHNTQSGVGVEAGQQMSVPGGGAQGRYVLVDAGLAGAGQMSLADVQVYAFGELWRLLGVTCMPLANSCSWEGTALLDVWARTGRRPLRALPTAHPTPAMTLTSAPCPLAPTSTTESNVAANKPVAASALRMIDRGGAGAVLQAVADNNATSCVLIQPDPSATSNNTLGGFGDPTLPQPAVMRCCMPPGAGLCDARCDLLSTRSQAPSFALCSAARAPAPPPAAPPVPPSAAWVFVDLGYVAQVGAVAVAVGNRSDPGAQAEIYVGEGPGETLAGGTACGGALALAPGTWAAGPCAARGRYITLRAPLGSPGASVDVCELQVFLAVQPQLQDADSDYYLPQQGAPSQVDGDGSGGGSTAGVVAGAVVGGLALAALLAAALLLTRRYSRFRRRWLERQGEVEAALSDGSKDVANGTRGSPAPGSPLAGAGGSKGELAATSARVRSSRRSTEWELLGHFFKSVRRLDGRGRRQEVLPRSAVQPGANGNGSVAVLFCIGVDILSSSKAAALPPALRSHLPHRPPCPAAAAAARGVRCPEQSRQRPCPHRLVWRRAVCRARVLWRERVWQGALLCRALCGPRKRAGGARRRCAGIANACLRRPALLLPRCLASCAGQLAPRTSMASFDWERPSLHTPAPTPAVLSRDVKLLERLGEGSYGVVYKAK